MSFSTAPKTDMISVSFEHFSLFFFLILILMDLFHALDSICPITLDYILGLSHRKWFSGLERGVFVFSGRIYWDNRQHPGSW